MGEEATATQEVANLEQEVVEEEKTEATTVEETGKEEISEGLTVDEIVSGTKKAKKGVQGRIDELTKEKYDARREADFWKNKANEVKKPESTVISSDRPMPPAESDFIDPNDYKKARVDYEDRLDAWKYQHRKNEEIQEMQKEELAGNIAKFNTISVRMREKYPDFDTAINEPVFTPILSNEVMASEYGPEIGYFLAKNPSEALRLSKLTPTGVAKEIGKLEVKFSQAVKKTNSKAPDPLNPIKGDDVPQKDPSKMTDAEWYKWEQEQKLKKRKLGG